MTDLEQRTATIIEPEKWVSKQCPVCNKFNDTDARICTCGFWFDQQHVLQQASDLPDLKREKLKKSGKKILIVTGFIAAILSVVAVWTGVIDLSRITRGEKNTRSDDSFDQTSGNPSAVPNNGIHKNIMEGKVTAVINGDTITILDPANNVRKIRLSAIEAPEADQGFADQAKDTLAGLVLGKPVTVILQKLDEDDLAGKVLLEGRNINCELVRGGLAWYNKFSALQSDEDRQIYADAETYAKTGKFGVWSNPNAVAPWESRTASIDAPVTEERRLLVDKTVKPSTSGMSSQPAVNGQQTTPVGQAPQNIASATPTAGQYSASAAPETIASPKQEVEKPAATNPGPVSANKTAGATAKCNDGTLSYRAIRTGSCTGHGGVAEWLESPKSPVMIDSNTRQYTLGPRGGCFYINPNGSKVYVDKSRCSQ